MLYLIGLGLGDAEDITCKGLAVIRRASRVYLEAYTSILTVGTEALVSKTRLCVTCGITTRHIAWGHICIRRSSVLRIEYCWVAILSPMHFYEYFCQYTMTFLALKICLK